MASATKQFEPKVLVPLEVGGYDISFTDFSLAMLIVVGLVTAIFTYCMRKEFVIPNRAQALAEILYNTVAGMVKENVGSQGRKYFPFIFTTFLFVLFANLLGMIPYFKTVTSQLIVTFTMAMVVFLGVTLIGFARHGIQFFTFFLPKGVPLLLSPLVVLIEVVSYLSRPISLSLRLFANMVVGHVLLKVIAGLAIPLGLLGIFPFIGLTAIQALELLVAGLQAYIFTILICIYLHDAIHMH